MVLLAVETEFLFELEDRVATTVAVNVEVVAWTVEVKIVVVRCVLTRIVVVASTLLVLTVTLLLLLASTYEVTVFVLVALQSEPCAIMSFQICTP